MSSNGEKELTKNCTWASALRASAGEFGVICIDLRFKDRIGRNHDFIRNIKGKKTGVRSNQIPYVILIRSDLDSCIFIRLST